MSKFRNQIQIESRPQFKILEEKLDLFRRQENSSFFGSWTDNISKLKVSFQEAQPFPHLKIDNFLNKDYIELISRKFPHDFENWYKYYNPLEVKFANDHIEKFDECIQSLFYMLSTSEIISLFSDLSGIKDLEYDPYLHGAGLHAHPRYGRLNLHLDYEKHPHLQDKERRLNIILFLSQNWKDDWKGDNQLWDNQLKSFISTKVKFNRAIIFQTNNISWHGLPDKIMCPEGVFRKSLAYYYISPLVSKNESEKFGNDGTGYRRKASYISLPHKEEPPQIKEFQKIRPYRRINERDLKELWPEWTPELY